MKLKESDVIRFWSKVQKSDGCWEWIEALNNKGYGVMGLKVEDTYKTVTAHRISYILSHGDIATGQNVCHRCDNPKCVNPHHLFLGTQKENMQDCKNKGRIRISQTHKKGVENNNGKLTEEQVDAIRLESTAGVSQRKLARKFGVSQPHIGRIVRRENR